MVQYVSERVPGEVHGTYVSTKRKGVVHVSTERKGEAVWYIHAVWYRHERAGKVHCGACMSVKVRCVVVHA